jgi:hypothetical protein
MSAMFYRVQEEYPHPEGAYWVPRRLGGSAPTPDESREFRVAELVERVQKHGHDGVTRSRRDGGRQNYRGGQS